MRGIVVLSGSSHSALVALICKRLCLPVGGVQLGRYANGELKVELTDSVRDMDVYIVQTAYDDVNEYLMELLIMIHACRSSSAARSNKNAYATLL